jgi:hypothetical protein
MVLISRIDFYDQGFPFLMFKIKLVQTSYTIKLATKIAIRIINSYISSSIGGSTMIFVSSDRF